MVRDYKRKTGDRWTKQDLMEAMLALKDGKLRINDAALQFGISRATLYRQYTKFVLRGCKADLNQFRTSGGSPILTKVEEDVFETTVKDLVKQGIKITPVDVKRICFEYCDVNKVPNLFNQYKRMASDDWYYGFLKRHPEVKKLNLGGSGSGPPKPKPKKSTGASTAKKPDKVNVDLQKIQKQDTSGTSAVSTRQLNSEVPAIIKRRVNSGPPAILKRRLNTKKCGHRRRSKGKNSLSEGQLFGLIKDVAEKGIEVNANQANSEVEEMEIKEEAEEEAGEERENGGEKVDGQSETEVEDVEMMKEEDPSDDETSESGGDEDSECGTEEEDNDDNEIDDGRTTIVTTDKNL